MADYQPFTCPKHMGKCNKFVWTTCTKRSATCMPIMGKFLKFKLCWFQALIHPDSSRTWIKLMHLGDARGPWSMGLHKVAWFQISWISPFSASLNFLALALVTGPTGTWIGSAIFHAFELSAFPSKMFITK